MRNKTSDRETKYEGLDPEFLRKYSGDMADMFKWFDNIGGQLDARPNVY